MNDKSMHYHLEGHSKPNRAMATFGFSIDRIAQSSPRDILEVGPYDGKVSHELLLHFSTARLTAVEYLDEHFQLLKDDPHLNAIHGDGFYPISQLGMSTGSYDAIFAMNNIWATICHSDLPARDYSGIFTEWKDLLRDQGWLATSWKTNSLVFQKRDNTFYLVDRDVDVFESVADTIIEASECDVTDYQENPTLAIIDQLIKALHY